jgi:glycine cleavage system pyridoxal-binding protein P
MREFSTRHIGINTKEQQEILQNLGYQDLDKFIADVIPNELLRFT